MTKNNIFHVYGIPTCSTCKKALKWLDDQNLKYIWVNTRETPPTKKQIVQWITNIGTKALQNTSGGSYRNLPKEKLDWNDDIWAEEFSKDAMLLKRPIFVENGIAICSGFRSSQVLEAHFLDRE